jgi:hypothetical protein
MCAEDKDICWREAQLRAWFVRDGDPVCQVVDGWAINGPAIDGLDIGWGGVQRWATARMPPVHGLHLDLACGYGTFAYGRRAKARHGYKGCGRGRPCPIQVFSVCQDR